VKGVELSRRYYREVVGPALVGLPDLPHGAARLGSGSDVLGLDDDVSQDHDWGLRLNLFVDAGRVGEVDEHLAEVLPESFLRLPSRFATTWDAVVRHRVLVESPQDFAVSRLGIDASKDLSVDSWLALTGQSVREVTAGEVFADSDGGITEIRRRLAWYPDDLWRHVVAADWSRLAQELPLMSRAGQTGDDLGASVIAGRLVRTAMHLGFLLERVWPPYAKWLGTAFSQLPRAGSVSELLYAVTQARTWQVRQDVLSSALTALHALQATVGLPTPSPALEPFWDRPFMVVRPQVVDALLESIADDSVRRLPTGVGSVEQWVDNVDVLVRADRRVAATTWQSTGLVGDAGSEPRGDVDVATPTAD
jgi:hypothetical protein